MRLRLHANKQKERASERKQPNSEKEANKEQEKIDQSKLDTAQFPVLMKQKEPEEDDKQEVESDVCDTLDPQTVTTPRHDSFPSLASDDTNSQSVEEKPIPDYNRYDDNGPEEQEEPAAFDVNTTQSVMNPGYDSFLFLGEGVSNQHQPINEEQKQGEGLEDEDRPEAHN